MHPTSITSPLQSPRPKVRIVRCRRRRPAGAVFHARMLLRSLRRFCLGAAEAALLMAGAAIYFIGALVLLITVVAGLVAAVLHEVVPH